MKRKNIISIVLITIFAMTMFVGCVKVEEEKEMETSADVVVDENTEIGTIQSKEPIEIETDVEQAYEDYMQEENTTKLEAEEEFTVVPFQTTFYVSSDTNVYEKPDNTSTILGQVTLNTEILTTGKVEEVDWYQFKFGNKEVFISKSFLSEKKLELEVVKEKEPEKTKEEYNQAVNNFKEQVKQEQANTTNPFAGGFTVTGSGDDVDWDKDNEWTGKITVH